MVQDKEPVSDAEDSSTDEDLPILEMASDGDNDEASAAQQIVVAANVADAIAEAPTDAAAKIEEVEEDGDVDEEGIEPAEIDFVMLQVQCSRAKAVHALKANNNDIVE